MVLAATKKLVHIKFQFIDKTSFSSLKNQSSGFNVKPHSSLREESHAYFDCLSKSPAYINQLIVGAFKARDALPFRLTVMA